MSVTRDYWYQTSEVRLVALADDAYIIFWSEYGRSAYRLSSKILDRRFNIISENDPIYLPRKHFKFDAAILPNGEYVMAWNENHVVHLQFCDMNGVCKINSVVGKSGKPGGEIDLAVFPSGELAIGCTDFLSVKTESGFLLCAISSEAWCATMTCLQNGSLVRTEMIAKNPNYTSELPRYGLHGSIIDRTGVVTNKFYLHVPTTIVGDVCSHPDHLAIAALSNGGFVIIWTQLGHTLGNSIQGQIFNCEGVALGDMFVVAAATLNSSVNNPAVTSIAPGGFLVAWSEDNGSSQIHRMQIFDNDCVRRGAVSSLNASTTEQRGVVKFCATPTGQTIAYWLENHGIQTIVINEYPVYV